MARYSKPWRPEKFLKGEQVTFPYEHETAFFYRAEPVSSFFGTNSILQKRYIEASNGFYTNGGEKGGGEELTAKSHGVFGGFLETAKFYARGDRPDPILKLQVPASDLVTIYVPPEEWDKRGEHEDPETTSFQSLEELEREFGTAEKMREVALKSLNNREGFGGYEFIMFMVPHEVPVDADRNWLKGVWDYQFFNQPHFETTSEYVQSLKARHPKAVPEGIEPDEVKEEIKRELEDLEQIGKYLGKINDSLKVNRAMLEANSVSELSEKHRKYLRGRLEKYEAGLEQIDSLIQQEFDIQIQREGLDIQSMVQINRDSVKHIKQSIEEVEEEIEQIHEEEMDHGRKIVKEERNAELFKQESEYEGKVEQRIAEDIRQLPTCRGLLQKLE